MMIFKDGKVKNIAASKEASKEASQAFWYQALSYFKIRKQATLFQKLNYILFYKNYKLFGAILAFMTGILPFEATIALENNESYEEKSSNKTRVPAPQTLQDYIGPNVYLPDFSYAGYKNGEEQIAPEYGTIVLVKDYGALPDDQQDDTLALQQAFAAARLIEGPVTIRFESGTYIITDILQIDRSHFVLQGAGSGKGGTVLHFPRPLAMVDTASKFDEIRAYLKKYDKRQREKSHNLDVLFSEYSWTGGFIWIGEPGGRPAAYLTEKDRVLDPLAAAVKGVRGTRFVVVDAPSGLVPGDPVQLAWFNRKGEGGPLLAEIYGSDDVEVGSHHWTFPDRPLVRQRTRIVAIKDDIVEISDPLLHNINPDLPAQFSRWTPLTEIGLEDIQLSFPNAPSFGHHVERGYNAIYFTGTMDGWVRNIRITNADSGILTYDAANLTLSNIITDGTREAHYAVHIGNVHNVLVDQLKVYNKTRHTATFNTQSTKSVYRGAVLFTDPVLDQHAGSNHQNLFDNMTVHLTPRKTNTGWAYALYDGSGAPYWQPGHGAYNTTWNMQVIVEGGAYRNEEIRLEGTDEGPNGRIIGLYGNRPFSLDYRPMPFLKALNTRALRPSLYDWQKEQRLGRRLQSQ